MSVVAKDSGHITILNKTVPVTQAEKRMALKAIKEAGYTPINTHKGKEVHIMCRTL